MNHLHKAALLVDPTVLEPGLVERAGPGTAPTAFRIWKAGENIADDGAIFFTQQSAAKLLAEQISRNRPLAIDFDHLSLEKDRPADAGRAAGWHRLDVRSDADGNPELWAVDVEWCADARAGLEEQPPRWRFFSPAFFTDDSAEVTSYINLALCINPMTHGIPMLASRSIERKAAMTADEQLAKLDALIEATDDADTKAALTAAREALSAKKSDEEDTSEEDPKTDAAGDDDEADKAAASDDDKKDDDKKDEKKAHAAGSDLASELVHANRRIEQLEIKSMLDKRGDLPESVRKWCAGQTSEGVRSFLSSMPKLSHAQRKDKPSQAQVGPVVPSLEAAQGEAMDRAMGLNTHAARMPQKLTDGRFVMHTVKPGDQRRHEAAQKAKV